MNITFSASISDEGSYIESENIVIDEHNYRSVDRLVDAIISNLKVRLLFHIRSTYPDVWHKDSPLNLNSINQLITNG